MIAARPSPHGFVIGEPRARTRDGAPAIELRHPRYVSTPGAAIRALLEGLASVRMDAGKPDTGEQLDAFGEG